MFFHTVLPGPLAHVASIPVPLPDLLPTSSAMLLLPCEVEPTARKLQSQQLATAPLLPSATSAEKDHFTSVSQISAATNKKRTTEDTSPAQKVVVVEEGNSENEAAFLQQTVVAAKSLGSRRLANYDSSRRPDVSLPVDLLSCSESFGYSNQAVPKPQSDCWDSGSVQAKGESFLPEEQHEAHDEVEDPKGVADPQNDNCLRSDKESDENVIVEDDFVDRIPWGRRGRAPSPHPLTSPLDISDDSISSGKNNNKKQLPVCGSGTTQIFEILGSCMLFTNNFKTFVSESRSGFTF